MRRAPAMAKGANTKAAAQKAPKMAKGPLIAKPSTAKRTQLAPKISRGTYNGSLLYTADAADELLCVELGGRRVTKKNECKQ